MPGEPCAVSALGCFGLRPRKPTLANLNKKGIYRRVAGQFTEPKKAKIQVSEKGRSQLPWGFIAAVPQGCSLGEGAAGAREDRSAQASPLLAPSHTSHQPSRAGIPRRPWLIGWQGLWAQVWAKGGQTLKKQAEAALPQSKVWPLFAGGGGCAEQAETICIHCLIPA